MAMKAEERKKSHYSVVQFATLFAKNLAIALGVVLATRVIILVLSGVFSSPDAPSNEVFGWAVFFGAIIVHVVAIGECTLSVARFQFERKGSFRESSAMGAIFAFCVGLAYGHIFFGLGAAQSSVPLEFDAVIRGALAFAVLGGAVAFFSCAIETDHWRADAANILGMAGKPVLLLLLLAAAIHLSNSYLASQRIIWSTSADCDTAGLYDNLVMAARTIDLKAKQEVFLTPAKDSCYLMFASGSRALCEKIQSDALRRRCLTSYVLSGRAKQDIEVCGEIPEMANCDAFVQGDASLCGDDECRRAVLISTGDYKACDMAARNTYYKANYQSTQLSFSDKEWCLLQIAKKNQDVNGCSYLEPSKAAYCISLVESAQTARQCKPYPYCESP